jgi:hypothetical protein
MPNDMGRSNNRFAPFTLPAEVEEIFNAAPSVTFAGSTQELSTRDAVNGWHEVAYDIPGRGRVVDAVVCRARNGILANYTEAYMRRRDPDCMVIGDKRPSDKPKFDERFGTSFEVLRERAFDWLKTQPLAAFAFHAGMEGKGTHAMVIAPDNCGFFALGLALLQGILPLDEIPAGFSPKAVIYVAPPFRHTDFDGKQVVVHNRTYAGHELFSFNLYPGPSAKKGIYGVLLNLGEKEQWVTMHCSTVRVVTPYQNKLVISHEGASGGGKSEMLEHVHRRPDGALLLGRNLANGDEQTLALPQACELHPVTDDMALCHPSLDKGNGKLTLMDAEDSWFVRCNHLTEYGTDPHLEKLCINPPEPLLFLNVQGFPGSTALIWEHTEDAPGQPCPNPRVIIPRKIVPNVVHGGVDVDVRSMGVRTPPCSAERPTYGILGLFHILPPALAWLWRLVAPRGHSNPSIVETEGMTSEGVGSYWPFATGRRVDQANLLLNQIIETPEVRYVLVPNQHIGIREVGFMPQWIMREFLARRGGARFQASQVRPSRCPLIGFNPGTIIIEGRTIGSQFFEVDRQPEVGPEAYDAGAAVLQEFFNKELSQFLVPDLLPTGRRIIEACMNGASLDEYVGLLNMPLFEPEE